MLQTNTDDQEQAEKDEQAFILEQRVSSKSSGAKKLSGSSGGDSGSKADVNSIPPKQDIRSTETEKLSEEKTAKR